MKLEMFKRRKHFPLGLTLCAVIIVLTSCASERILPIQNEKTIALMTDTSPTYTELISEKYPDYKISPMQNNNTFFSNLAEGKVMACSDLQAVPALAIGLAEYWQPQYLATAVIAIDKDQTSEIINTWSDLLNTESYVSLNTIDQDYKYIMLAMAKGLEGKANELKKTSYLLHQIFEKGLLAIDELSAPIMLCFDYQAARMKKEGRNIEIVIPDEGTVTYQIGLLAKTTSPLDRDMEAGLLQAGFRLLNGRCDELLYPPEFAYEAAESIQNYSEMSQTFQKTTPVFRRQVIKTRLYSSANSNELFLFVFTYILCLTIWTASVLHRMMQKNLRYASLLASIMFLLWNCVRLVKYLLLSDRVLTRYLWYSYYIFQLALPLIFLYIAWRMDKSEQNVKVPKWFGLLSMLHFIALVLVFTNDLHQWVFIIDISDQNASTIYDYGVGFYLVTVIWLFSFILSLSLLLYKNITSPRRWGFIFPLAFCLLLLTYTYGYVTGQQFAVDSDLTMVAVVLSMFLFETSLRSGVVIANVKYDKLFKHSRLNLQIVEKDTKQVALAGLNATAFDTNLLTSAVQAYPLPVKQTEKSLLYAKEIMGGYAIYQEDISVLLDLQSETEQSIHKLSSLNAILMKEKKLNEDLGDQINRSKLAELFSDEMAQYLLKLSNLVEQLAQKENAVGTSAQIALLTCYLKRRCQFFYLEQEQKIINAQELLHYLNELEDLSIFMGIKAFVQTEIEGDLSSVQARMIYDFFYLIIEWHGQQNRVYLVANLLEKDEGILFRVLSSESIEDYILPKEIDESVRRGKVVVTFEKIDENYAIGLFFPKEGAGHA